MKSNIQLKHSNYAAFSLLHGCTVNNLGLIYDPSTGVDKRNGDENGNVSTENNTKGKEDIDYTDYDIPEDQNDIPEDEGDAGADGYDDFGNETIINDENIVD